MKPVTIIDKQKVPQNLQDSWVILWDGECGFCRRAVDWILARDRSGRMKAQPFQEALAWLPAEVVELSNQQVHVLDPDGHFWGGGDAVIKALSLAGLSWVALVLALPGASAANALAYRAVAQRREMFSKFLFRSSRSEKPHSSSSDVPPKE